MIPFQITPRILSGVVLLIASITTMASAQGEEVSPENSLVRVNATLQEYSFLRPWEKGAPTPRRGLGAVLEGQRVLVTAEMCVNSTYLELEHPSTGAKVPAKIVAQDYEANMALLEPTIKDSEVFAGLVPLQIDESVVANDTLEVWQIEDNGDGVTTDVDVLRVTVGRYYLPGTEFLLYQIKGSLQARANSFTLPVIKDKKLVGMLLSYSSKEQTATVLAAPVINAFLDDLEDGDYTGFPNMGISFARTLDDQLREFAGLEDNGLGVFISSVAKDSSAEKAGLEQGDIILRMNGKDIDSRGNFDHEKYGKLKFSHLVRGGAKVGDKVSLDIIRDAKPQTIEMELIRKAPEDYLIDPYMYDRGPKYVIFGGMIFQELTKPYLQSFGDNWETRAPFKLLYAEANPEQYEEEGRDKLVFLSNVLKTPSTIGYEGINSIVVETVNDVPIKNIRDLSNALANPPLDGIHSITFKDFPKVIYVDDRTSRSVNEQLRQYGINLLERLD